MSRIIRARAKRGIFEPLELVTVPDGLEVMVTIPEEVSPENIEAFHHLAGSWQGTIDAEKLIRDICNDRLLSTRPQPWL